MNNLSTNQLVLGSIIVTATGSNIYANQQDILSNLNTNLTQTGISLYNRDLSMSGALVSQISSNAAGVSSINGLSGTLNLSNAGSNIFIVNSGQTIFASGSGIASSINLYLTGQSLFSNYTGLSGSLYSTGQVLYNDIVGLSGVLNTSGITLQNEINTLTSNYTGISGSLIQSGISLLTIIGNTGQQSWSAANNNGINLSGNLAQTGISLKTSINSLSGFLTGKYLTGIVAGNNTTVNNNNNGTFTINSTASGSSSAYGSDGYVQFNKNGLFSGDPGFTWVSGVLSTTKLNLPYFNGGFTGVIYSNQGGTANGIVTNVGIDRNFIVYKGITLTDGIAISSEDNTFGANLSMEFRASDYLFWNSPVKMDGPLTLKNIVGTDISIGGDYPPFNASGTLDIDSAGNFFLNNHSLSNDINLKVGGPVATTSKISIWDNTNSIYTAIVGSSSGISLSNNLLVSGNISTSGINISGGRILSNTNLSLISNNNLTGMILSGSRLCLYGDTSGSAPSTNTLTVPVTIPTYGAVDKLCGNPNGFLVMNLSGRAVKIPYYY